MNLIDSLIPETPVPRVPYFERKQTMTLHERVCEVLEYLALDAEPTLEFVSNVYRFAHIANAPDCLKNHPKWLEEFEVLENALSEDGVL